MPQTELKKQKKHNNEVPLVYVAIYNEDNQDLLTEIIKNLKELENKDKIKKILDTTKII